LAWCRHPLVEEVLVWYRLKALVWYRLKALALCHLLSFPLLS
jgi:hypothetical protein